MILNDVELYEGHIAIYIMALFYFEHENYMIDADGCIVYDIFNYITPSQLRLFKERKEWMIVQGVDGDPIELVYSESPGVYEYHNPNSFEEEVDE